MPTDEVDAIPTHGTHTQAPGSMELHDVNQADDTGAPKDAPEIHDLEIEACFQAREHCAD